MSTWTLTRRAFLGLLGAAGLTTTVGCPCFYASGAIVFRRSGKGRHVSKAAKKHNANRLYATHDAALNDPAHPGDNSKVVNVTIGRAKYDRLFGSGRMIADLRHEL